MLKSFRRMSNSKVGLIVLAVIGLMIGLGFVAADMQNVGVGGTGGPSGGNVAKVGSAQISSIELQDRVQRALENARQENPELTIQQFVRDGGVEQVLRQMTDSIAIEQFARKQGFGVSRRMEDAQIASAPAFRGLNGQFDQTTFEGFLAQQRVSEKQLRADLARDMYVTQLIVPVTGATIAPASLTLPYASMLLEQRSGRAQFVPAAAMRGAAPTDAELTDYYRKNIARYTIPERRVMHYAPIHRAAFEAAGEPTEAEIAEAYNAAKATYAPRQTRTISQVILPTEAAARELAGKVASGTPMADAARAAGFESITLNDQTRETYVEASSAAVADAVFATAASGVAPPARSGLGWHVARVDAIVTTPGKTLEQARAEIAERLRAEKVARTFEDARLKIEEAITDGSTFDEVVAANKLQAIVTPALLADGRTPEAPTATVTPELATIAKAGFAAEPGDDPTVEAITADQTYALVKVDRMIPATARPLADIRAEVAANFVADRALAAARRTADGIVAKVNAGTPLAQATGSAGVPLPAAATLGGRRGELMQQDRQAQPQFAALFNLVRGKASIVPAPDRSGWYVVQLENLVPGDARTQPQLIEATRAQFAPVLGQEYGQQLAAAARQAVGVNINAAAVASLKNELIGANAPVQ